MQLEKNNVPNFLILGVENLNGDKKNESFRIWILKIKITSTIPPTQLKSKEPAQLKSKERSSNLGPQNNNYFHHSTTQ